MQNQNWRPMIVIEQAHFTGSLAGLKNDPVVTLTARVQFMQAASRLNLSTTWDFNDRDTGIDALREALVNAL